MTSEQVSVDLEAQVDGFTARFGGEDLKRAHAALSGALVDANLRASLRSAAHNLEDIEPHTRELAFAAKQYAAAAEAAPGSYDTLYHHGLVLYELASRVPPRSNEQMSLLQQACDKFEAALSVRPACSNALYQWGVALSDLARACKQRSAAEARACLHLASQKFAVALAADPSNVQAMNNWGLVLQELSTDAADAAARDTLVAAALEKFRAAIRLLPDFDRGAYNLGTTYYTHASALQAAAGSGSKPGIALVGALLGSHNDPSPNAAAAQQAAARRAYASAAQYIALAAAMQPGKEVYRKSLAIVKPLLALPFLRVGYLAAPAADTIGTINETWMRQWFVLDHASFRTASPVEISLSQAGAGVLSAASQAAQRAAGPPHEAPLVIPLADILAVRRCNDPSLPAGEAFWVCLQHMRQGIHFVADDAESADCWADALLLAHQLAASRGSGALAEALLPQAQTAAGGGPPPSARRALSPPPGQQR